MTFSERKPTKLDTINVANTILNVLPALTHSRLHSPLGALLFVKRFHVHYFIATKTRAADINNEVSKMKVEITQNKQHWEQHFAGCSQAGFWW